MRIPKMERCVSGLNGSPGKTVCQQWHRGFESRPFRQFSEFGFWAITASPRQRRGSASARILKGFLKSQNNFCPLKRKFGLPKANINLKNLSTNLFLSPSAKEKNRLIAIRAIQISFVNRRLVAGRLEIDFKKPFDLLAKLPAEARGEAPSEATNSIWWTRPDLNR